MAVLRVKTTILALKNKKNLFFRPFLQWNPLVKKWYHHFESVSPPPTLVRMHIAYSGALEGL